MSTVVYGANHQAVVVQRSCAVLSDGSVAVLVHDSSTNSLYIYHSPDRVTWNLEATVTAASGTTFDAVSTLGAGGIGVASLAADAGDNLYLCYSTINTAHTSHKLLYRKLSKGSGYSWTAGAEELIVDSANEWQFLDMDMLATDIPIVVATDFSAANAHYIIYIRKSGGAWATVENVLLGSTTTKYALGGYCTIGRDAGGIVSGVAKYAVMIGQGATGSLLYVGSVNTSTAALTKSIVQTVWVGYPAGTLINFNIFSTGSGEYTILGAIGSNLTAARIDNTGAYLTNWLPGTTPAGSGFAGIGAGGVAFSWAGNGTGGGGNPLNAGLFTFMGGAYWRSQPVVLRSGTFYMGITGNWDQALHPEFNTFVSAGSNRNFTQYKHDHIRRLSNLILHRGNIPPPAGVTDQPAAGGTVATASPTFVGHLATTPVTQTRWHGVFVVTDPSTSITTNFGGSKTDNFGFGTSSTVTTSSALPQHTFNMYTRFEDELGVPGVASSTTSFSVSHPPSALPSYPNGYSPYTTGDTTFTWAFNDPWSGDHQTAYQIVVENNDTLALIWDTGKVFSNATSVIHNFISTYRDQSLRWKIRLWDGDDVGGAYSDYKLFSIVQPPVVNVTSPTDAEVIATPAPLVTWTYLSPTSSAASRFQVRIWSVHSNALVYDSGVLPASARSVQLPDGTLHRSVSYTMRLDTADARNVAGVQDRLFSTYWEGPPRPTGIVVSSADYPTLGYVRITWNGTPIDPYFTGWHVWRRIAGSGDDGWVFLHRSIDISASYEFHDWGACSQTSYDYVVVQEALRFGTPTESDYDDFTTVRCTTSDYWLISGVDASLNLRLKITTAETFTEEVEEADIKLIGRGTKREFGTRWGFKGTLTCQVYGEAPGEARAFRLALLALKDDRSKLYLRNPFGDLWLVAASDIGIARIPGVGGEEYHTVTIPYQEVT